MYTQLKRLLSMLLLSSMLLQGCGHPECRMMEPIDARDEVDKSQPLSQTPDHVLERSVGLNGVLSMSGPSSDLAEAITGQCAPGQQPLGAPRATPEDVVRRPLAKIESRTHHGMPQASSSASSNNSVVQTYPIAHGQQVNFYVQEGKWLAQVQDVWGHIQVLPVVCAPDQTPEQAIALLASKTLDQYKYCIHILDTNQSRRTSRVVYVGALGLRGGSFSGDRGDFFNNRRTPRVDLFSVGIGSRGVETRFGPRNNYADSMAANNAVNDAMRRARETRNFDASAFASRTNSGLETPISPRPRSNTFTSPRSNIRTSTSTFEPHREGERPRRREWERESDDFFERSRQRAEAQFAQQEREAEQEAREREQQDQQRAREAWKREQAQKKHEQEAKQDYEEFCRSGTTKATTSNNNDASNCDTDKAAYFHWKEQEEIRIDKEAKVKASEFYFKKWQQQEVRRKEEERKSKLDEAYRREERRRQEAPRREREERKARLDEIHRREEQRRRREANQEVEERRARLDEAHRREEERRRQEEERAINAQAEEDSKMPARPSASAQPEQSSTNVPSTTQQTPAGATVSRGFVLNSEGKLQPHEVRVPFAAPAGYQEARAAEVPLYTKKSPVSDAYFNSSSSPVEVEKSVKDYLQKFQGSTREERAAMQPQGEQLLKGVEGFKITKKEAYRGQVETFVTQDVDPVVWNTVLQKQKDTKAQTDTLRDLRSQLVGTLQPTSEVLETAGIQATFNKDNEVTYYSSDEDEQMLSSEEMQRRKEVVEEVVDGIMEGGPTLGAGAAAKLAGKVPKIVKAAKGAGKVVQKGAQGAAVARGAAQVQKGAKGAKVLQSGGHTLTNRTLKGLGLNQQQANKAIESMKREYRIPGEFHGQIMSNGDYINPHTKKFLGNLFDFID